MKKDQPKIEVVDVSLSVEEAILRELNQAITQLYADGQVFSAILEIDGICRDLVKKDQN